MAGISFAKEWEAADYAEERRFKKDLRKSAKSAAIPSELKGPDVIRKWYEPAADAIYRFPPS